jgi:hypothetical protein
MTSVLAEIVDKMGSAYEFWLFGLLFGGAAYYVIRAHKRMAVLGLATGLFFFWSCGSEFLYDRDWATLIHKEMGLFYLASAAGATGLLTLLGTVVGFFARPRFDVGTRICKCGYSLTGNTSGVCPECRTTVGSSSTPPECGERI